MRREMLFMCQEAFKQQHSTEGIKINGKYTPLNIIQLQPKAPLCDQAGVQSNAL